MMVVSVPPGGPRRQRWMALGAPAPFRTSVEGVLEVAVFVAIANYPSTGSGRRSSASNGLRRACEQEWRWEPCHSSESPD